MKFEEEKSKWLILITGVLLSVKFYLRFGIKLYDSGNVSYHANYSYCADRNGISASSPEKLLEQLMADE